MTFPKVVQRLRESARDAYRTHLLALNSEDTRLRFGGTQTSAAVADYVDRIDFDVDSLFGVYNPGLELDGAAHLALDADVAELGLSVLPHARRQGIGRALLHRSAEYARNRSIRRLYVHCLAENVGMIRLASHAGMDVVVQSGDADAHVVLPAATPASITNEFVAERVALYDYALKNAVETWRRIATVIAKPE